MSALDMLVHFCCYAVGQFAVSIIWIRYVRSERCRLRVIASRFGVTLAEDLEPNGKPLCVVCGADCLEQIVWGYGPPGEVPNLMRSLNLCEECGYRVAQEIA